MQSHKGFDCIDCHRDTWNEYYMLYSRIWKKAHPTGKGMLCIGCVEKRLGRKLTKKDFTTLPVNTDKDTRSARLRNRLSN